MKRKEIIACFNVLSKTTMGKTDEKFRVALTTDLARMLPIQEETEKGIKDARERLFGKELLDKINQISVLRSQEKSEKNEDRKKKAGENANDLEIEINPEANAAQKSFEEFKKKYNDDDVTCELEQFSFKDLCSILDDSELVYTPLDMVFLNPLIKGNTTNSQPIKKKK